MKRIVALIVALIMSCTAVSALAAGNIQATDDTASYVLSHSDGYRVYYYAVVTNAGDERASINDLLFEIRDRGDVTFESTSKYTLYPEILEPGQTGWLVITKDVKDVDEKGYIDHFNLTITTKAADDDKEVRPLTAAAEYVEKDEDDNENVIRATVTNEGSENAFEITIAAAARDAEGKLLYIASDATKDIGLRAGSQLMLRSLIKTDLTDEWEDTHVTVASAEAMAYTVEDIDD